MVDGLQLHDEEASVPIQAEIFMVGSSLLHVLVHCASDEGPGDLKLTLQLPSSSICTELNPFMTCVVWIFRHVVQFGFS